MTSTAFIPGFTIPKHLLEAKQSISEHQTRATAVPRRAFLVLLAAIPLPALADRTGKYSTKQTAKNRYLPRIAKGVDLIRASQTGGQLDQDAMKDFFSAMELFATTYFSEGNRVGRTERELSMLVKQIKVAYASVQKGGDPQGLVSCVNDFVVEAGLPKLASIQLIQ